ncbi:Hint domain-containing protein [Asaia sp. HumB]|uniref:Hint domain-containing protein n=1 Tax=Asaia sp. HumB TaxID=3035475 RepID=UPI0025524282|nr:Hint domain-containing protein [Asaia sp. HumB]MDL2170395.1 Hint domain-containing protein [Asaia sp. HumB]
MAITSNVTASGAKISSAAGVYSVLSGATLTVQGAGFVTNGAIVSGFGKGPNNSGAIPGQSGGTNYPALLLASAGGIVSGSTVGFGGVAMGVYGGTAAGGTAMNSGSFAAANGGFVSGVTIGSNGGLLASTVAGEGGGAGTVIDSHVLAGGYALAGGGFTIKGQAFAGSGVISRGTFDVGSTEILVSGGTDVGSLIGGTQFVSSGASALKSIFSAGTQLISAGGVASGSIASAGGRIEVYAGGVGSSFTIGSGGTLHVNANGIVNGVQIQAAGAASADAAAVVNAATISGGGTLTLASGATLVNGVLAGTTKDGGAGGLLVLESGAVLSGVTRMGWKSRLDIDSLLYNSGARIQTSGNTVSVLGPDGTVLWTGSLTAGVASDYHLEADPTDGSMVLVYDKCFLKGTMIRTDRGEIAVENLVVGDQVLAMVNGKEVLREIIWTGHRSTTVRQGLPDDEAGYPVRIKQNALGENVPHKDLLVTPEHAMFLNGAFVPARMLVNGSSIFYDRTITQFDFYHVETDEHSVIWSDGALSESYLDTGDRKTFSLNSPVVRLLNAPQRDWALHAAAPLKVERDFVEPLFNELEARAKVLGMERMALPAATTGDSDLHLVDTSGRVIRALRKTGRAHVFMVPADASELRIVSRTARPVDMVGPFVDDRRHLGVLVGEIQIWEAGETRVLDTHLKADALSGWANREQGAHRWTTGNAVLPLTDMRSGVAAMLSIEIQAGGPYLIEKEADVDQAAAG